VFVSRRSDLSGARAGEELRRTGLEAGCGSDLTRRSTVVPRAALDCDPLPHLEHWPSGRIAPVRTDWVASGSIAVPERGWTVRYWGDRDDEDGAQARAPVRDEYAELLGSDWEASGDGTYRYVGRASSLPGDDSQELTGAQRALLRTIGSYGATEAELESLPTGAEMTELIEAGYVTHEPMESTGLPDAWYLTDSGADAMGVAPAQLRGVGDR
jgi:hypothetical protein